MLDTTLGIIDVILLVTYVGIELGLSEWSTDGNKYDKVNGSLIGYWIGFLDTLEIGYNEGHKLGYPNGK